MLKNGKKQIEMIDEKKMYSIRCDGCGKRLTTSNGSLILRKTKGALNRLEVDDWLFQRIHEDINAYRHFCENCWTLDDNDEPKILNDGKS
jgi:hypothetical protein